MRHHTPMRMTRKPLSLTHILTSACALAALAPVQAQEFPGDDDYPGSYRRTPVIEITPFIGYRMGGEFELGDTNQDVDLDSARSFSLALNFPIDEVSQYELFYGRQESNLEADSPLGPVDVDVEYLHIGGTLVLNQERRVTPYIVGTLGATRFSPDSPSADEETRFSLSLGGGFRVPFTRSFSLRLEARGFATFVDTKSAIFCISDELGGLCRIRARSDVFFQYEFMAGASFAF